MTIDKELLERQALAFTFVGSLLRTEPEKEWLESLVQNRVFEEIPYRADQKAVAEGQRMLTTWMDAYDNSLFDELYNDYMALFVGPAKPLASPWESTYSKDSEGLLFQKETLDVRKWYKSFGFQIENLYHEPDDHIAFELEFIAKLSEKASLSAQNNEELEARQLLESQGRFMKQHILVWHEEWADRVLENAQTEFYRGIALLVRGFLRE